MEDRYLSKAKRVDNGEWAQGNLIQNCDATDGWEANPYVLVIEFVKIDKPEEIQNA